MTRVEMIERIKFLYFHIGIQMRWLGYYESKFEENDYPQEIEDNVSLRNSIIRKHKEEIDNLFYELGRENPKEKS